MEKKTPMYQALKNLAFLTQVGVSIAAPRVLCIFGASWLQNRFQLGGWVVFLGFLLGVGGACSSLVGFIRLANKQAGKKNKEGPSSFNDRW